MESSILKFEKLKNSLLNKNEIQSFIKFKRYIFSHKRKSLRNVLKKYNLDDSDKLNLRAEKLDLNDLIDIFRKVKL